MIVFDIKRYAINDGPGIRTTVFLKGCPLRCVWCHNPESWRPQPEWLFKAKKCIACNTCGVHPHQFEAIRNGELQATIECPTLALEICGQERNISDLLAEIEKERDIMRDSGGGVTISGGEPLMQMDDGKWKMENGKWSMVNGTAPLLCLLRELGLRGIHRAIDTTLYASPDVVRAVAAEADLFLVDLKVMDAEKHKRFTGVSNELILSNFRLLASLSVPFQIRIPLIEGINADSENIEQTASLLEDLKNASLQGVALLPYHEMGRDKHARRGTTYNPAAYPLATPSDATIERCIRQFADHSITATIGG